MTDRQDTHLRDERHTASPVDPEPKVEIEPITDLDVVSDQSDEVRGGKCFANGRYTSPSNTTA